MYECFHCGARAVVWDSDFTYTDMGYEEEIVHQLHCENCGAFIQYEVPRNLDNDVDNDSQIFSNEQ